MNLCFAAACIGWIAQFFPTARQDIICRKDGTARVSEPRYGTLAQLSRSFRFMLDEFFV